MPTREEMHNLGQGIIASFEARTAGITALREEVREQHQATQAQLGELDRNHRAMARQLRTGLTQGRAALQEEVRGYRQGTQVHLREIEAAVREHRQATQTQLHEVDRAHQAMARHLRADLARERDALTQDETRRKAAVRALMDHVADERAGGQKEWHRLAHTMAGKRNGVTVTEELATSSDRVFQYLANHPDGARLTEIEREFGLGRLQAGRVMRHLMDEGKAEKREFCYFAT